MGFREPDLERGPPTEHIVNSQAASLLARLRASAPRGEGATPLRNFNRQYKHDRASEWVRRPGCKPTCLRRELRLRAYHAPSMISVGFDARAAWWRCQGWNTSVTEDLEEANNFWLRDGKGIFGGQLERRGTASNLIGGATGDGSCQYKSALT